MKTSTQWNWFVFDTTPLRLEPNAECEWNKTWIGHTVQAHLVGASPQNMSCNICSDEMKYKTYSNNKRWDITLFLHARCLWLTRIHRMVNSGIRARHYAQWDCEAVKLNLNIGIMKNVIAKQMNRNLQLRSWRITIMHSKYPWRWDAKAIFRNYLIFLHE